MRTPGISINPAWVCVLSVFYNTMLVVTCVGWWREAGSGETAPLCPDCPSGQAGNVSESLFKVSPVSPPSKNQNQLFSDFL